ncbi:MAG: hypothetical protein IBJ11_07525 [Phycisphaerales bacterium]|nr:hypothetical protein [Phycisphaerales bacterium]
MKIVSTIVMALAAGAALAPAASAQVTAPTTNVTLTGQSRISIDPTRTMPPTRGYGPSITWPVSITNGPGLGNFNIVQTVIRLGQYPGESYAPGEFPAINFQAGTTSITNAFSGLPVPLTSVVRSPDGQTLTINFPNAQPFSLTSRYVFTFTVLNPAQKLYNFDFEFLPIPSPGALTLAGVAGLFGLRRRRG